MFKKIVLSGGPCSGKTTALPLIAAYFRSTGYTVYTVPEVATFLHSCGVDLTRSFAVCRQTLLQSSLELQTQLEFSVGLLARQLALPAEKVLLIQDRGLIDYKAYVSNDFWQTILELSNLLNDTQFATHRYNHVIFLETAAKGALAHFTNANNPARNCSPELAIELDNKTLEAWKSEGYNPAVISNEGSHFTDKVMAAIKAIENLLV